MPCSSGITRPLTSSYEPRNGPSVVRIHFKIDIDMDKVAGALAAMIERARIQTLRLQRNRSMTSDSMITRVLSTQSNNDKSFVSTKGTWGPLMQKLELFDNLASAYSEVNQSPFPRIGSFMHLYDTRAFPGASVRASRVQYYSHRIQGQFEYQYPRYQTKVGNSPGTPDCPCAGAARYQY